MNGLINYNPAWNEGLKTSAFFETYQLAKKSFKRLEVLQKGSLRHVPEDELRQLRADYVSRIQGLYDAHLRPENLPTEITDLIEQMVLETGNKRPFYFFREPVDLLEHDLNKRSQVLWNLNSLWSGQGDVILNSTTSRQEAKTELLRVVLQRNKAAVLEASVLQKILRLESEIHDVDLILANLR